jgi:hypothetical protein
MVAVRHGSPWLVGVSGLCPGIGCRGAWRARPGQARCLPAWVVIGAGWGRLTRAGESGKKVRGGGHGALGVGRRCADRVPAWEEAPVIHPVARGGPGCRAVLGGSINLTAVLIDAEKEARHRSELARACTSRPGERESGVSWRWSCRLGQLAVVVVGVRLVVEAADLAVAQSVVAKGEDLAGDRDLGDAAPAALGDPLEGGAQGPAAGTTRLGSPTSATTRSRRPRP